MPSLRRILTSTIGVVLLVVLTQDIQIFPGAAWSVFENPSRDPATLPKGTESIFVNTNDGERLEVWRLGVEQSPVVALIFHGNAQDVAGFFAYQQFFEALGVTSYNFDFRGFGKSSGWPSEEGLYKDGRAVAAYVLAREQIRPTALVVVGISLGTGPATRIAREISPGTLLLVAPYTSLPDVIATVPLMGLLRRFSFYQFPTEREIRSLSRTTCAIVLHGEQDEVIPYTQGQAVFQAIDQSLRPIFISVPTGHHNDAFFLNPGQLARQLSVCRSR